MAFVPPWLSFGPLDFVHAAAQGAGLGLQRAQIDTGANEAADRLKLGYAQLAAEQERAQMAEHEASERTHAALLLRAQQNKSMMDHYNQSLALQKDKASQLNDYRTNRLEQFGDEEDRKQGASDSLNQYRGNRLGQIDAGLATRTGRKLHFGPNGQVLGENPDGTISELRPANPHAPKLSSVHTKVEDEFGNELTGPVDDPRIAAILQAKADKQKASAASALEPSLVSRAWRNIFGSPAPTATDTWQPPPGLSSSAGSSLSIPSPQAPQPFNPPKRVRVVGPNGETGTIEENDTLPDDWKLAQ